MDKKIKVEIEIIEDELMKSIRIGKRKKRLLFVRCGEIKKKDEKEVRMKEKIKKIDKVGCMNKKEEKINKIEDGGKGSI